MHKKTRMRKKLSRKDDEWCEREDNYGFFLHQQYWDERIGGYYYYERGGITCLDSYYYKTISRHRTIRKLFHKYNVETWSAFRR